VNENASLWRRAWKRRERSTELLPEPRPVDAAPVDTTWALVQALPTRQRTAIALRFYSDLSVAETAETMGCSEGAVKTHTGPLRSSEKPWPEEVRDDRPLRARAVRPAARSPAAR
jgi:DNA-directed RNA polymerase specialized sigma24 family protein